MVFGGSHYPRASLRTATGELGTLVVPGCTMRLEMLHTTGKAWVCKYQNISSDHHWPRRQMQLVSMLVHRSAMVPLAHKEQAEMSLGLMP